MARNKIGYEYRLSEGRPIRRGQTVVTPISRVLTVRLPYWSFVWNRPVAVRLEEDGSTAELPIIDLTLLAQIVLFSLGFAAAMVAILTGRTQKG